MKGSLSEYRWGALSFLKQIIMKRKSVFKPKPGARLIKGTDIIYVGVTQWGQFGVGIGSMNLPSATNDYFLIDKEELLKALRKSDYLASPKRTKEWLTII